MCMSQTCMTLASVLRAPLFYCTYAGSAHDFPAGQSVHEVLPVPPLVCCPGEQSNGAWSAVGHALPAGQAVTEEGVAITIVTVVLAIGSLHGIPRYHYLCAVLGSKPREPGLLWGMPYLQDKL